MCFLFVSHQSNNNSWDTAFLKFDREKSKVKVTGEVNVQGHIVHPVSNLCTFSFHINRTTHSWDMSYRVFDHEKTHPKFSKKIWQKKVSSRIPPKSNQVRRPERYSYQVFQWLVEWFSLYPADNQIFVHQCHSCDLGSRSQEGHPVHFPRPTVKSLI